MADIHLEKLKQTCDVRWRNDANPEVENSSAGWREKAVFYVQGFTYPYRIQ